MSLLLALLLAQSEPQRIETYRDLHAHPELSHHEEHTSALLAAELRKAGFTVTERLGKYPDGAQAWGVLAVLQNGRARSSWSAPSWTRCPSPRRRACPTPAPSRMLLGQPSEETIDGAKALLADHLYERFGKPARSRR